MTDSVTSRLASVAASVMQALEPLAEDERARVLRSVAALYGVSFATSTAGTRRDALEQRNESDPDRAAGTKPLSVIEFLRDKQPATNAQRIASFAYYREHVEQTGSRFSRDDLKPYFEAAKLARPSKYDRDYNTAVAEGWIHDAGANSYLTQHGERAVQAGFGGKGKPRGQSVKKKADKKAAAKIDA